MRYKTKGFGGYISVLSRIKFCITDRIVASNSHGTYMCREAEHQQNKSSACCN